MHQHICTEASMSDSFQHNLSERERAFTFQCPNQQNLLTTIVISFNIIYPQKFLYHIYLD